MQNRIDIMSIIMSIVFCILRILNPKDYSYTEEDALYDYET